MIATFDFKREFISVSVIWHEDSHEIKEDRVILKSSYRGDKETAIYLQKHFPEIFHYTPTLENNIENIYLTAYFKDIDFSTKERVIG